MRLLVTGNCQAASLADLLARHGGFEAMPGIVLHAARAQDEAVHREAMGAADVVLAQVTAPRFRLPWLGSRAIRDAHGAKVMVWPNIFHIVDQPFLRYLTRPDGRRVLGPMEGYHDLRLLRAWLREEHGRDWRPEVDLPGFADRATAAAQASLTAREAGCDVVTADLIEREAGRRPLFFSFNHPRAWLLARLAERALGRLGRLAAINDAGEREPLGRVVVPSRWIDPEAGGRPYRCFEVALGPGTSVELGRLGPCGADELRERSFACYRHALPDPAAVDGLLATPDL